MKSFARSRLKWHHILNKSFLEPLKNEKNISGQTLLGYSTKIKFENIYLQNNLLKIKNSTGSSRAWPDVVQLESFASSISLQQVQRLRIRDTRYRKTGGMEISKPSWDPLKLIY